MRSINVRFLLVSVGLVVVVAVGAHLLHEMQVRRSAGILLEQGKRRIEARQFRDGLSFLQRYVSLAPHNAEAQVLLADTLAGLGQNAPAIRWYEQALLRDASQHEARRRLVIVAIAARRFALAKSHLIDFLIPSDSDNAQFLYLLGKCHEQLGEYQEAVQKLQDAVASDAAFIDAYSLLAIILRQQIKDVESADALMDQVVTANGASAMARLARADYRAKYQIGGVADDVKDAVRLAPDDLGVVYRAAQIILELALGTDVRKPLLADAEELLQHGLAKQPRSPAWYLGLAQVDRAQGDLDAAIAHLEDGLAAAPKDGDLQWNYADMLIQQERIDEGLGIVASLRDQGYPKVPLEYLLAMADARRKKFVDASERLSAIRGQMEDWPDLARQTEYWLGVCYERLGEYGLQLAAFRNATRIDPFWVPARQWLATALARTGRIDEAITEYQELAKLTGVPVSVYRQLASLIVLRELQRRQGQRNWQQVVAFLDHAGKIDPDAAEYITLKAEVQAAQNATDAARRTLEQGVQNHPESVIPLLALAALEQRAENWEQADSHIQAASDKFGDTIEVRLARLRYLVQRFGADSYDRLRELELRELSADEDQEQQWRTSLAAAYFTLGKTDDAERLWRKAVDIEPDNIRLRVFLFDLALSAEDDARMQELLDNIRRIERSEQQPLWAYGEATRLLMLARKGDSAALTKAERLLEEVRAARQTWSRIPLLQAEIADIRGEFDMVVELYLAAIDLGERSPTTIRRVVELLYRQRRYAEADSVLRRFEATQLPITGELGRLAADVSFRVQDFSRAMQIAVQVIGDSDKYEDLVWMGQLHSVMKQANDAEGRFAAAIKKQPATPDAWVALVQHFTRNAETQRADLAIRTLTKMVREDSVDFVEATCRNAIGDEAGALRKFDEASRRADASVLVLRTSADFFLSRGLSGRGEPLLKRILADASSSPADLAWARRNLAIVWAAGGDDAAKANALQLVEQNLRLTPDSTDDLRAKAICLELAGGKKGAEAALAIVERLVNMRRSTPADQLLAYRLCLALDRRADARKHLEQHTFENSSDPQSLIRYILFVLQSDELSEAQIWIDRLERLCLEGYEMAKRSSAAERQLAEFRRFLVVAAGLHAQLAVQQGDTTAAIQQITRRVGPESDSAATLTAVDGAQVLTALARQFADSNESAADALRKAAESTLSSARSPRESVALVAMLAQQNRVAEAVSEWSSRFDPSAADEFALAGAALAAHPHVVASQLAEIAERVGRLSPQQRSKAVLVSLSQLYTLQSRHAEVVSVLREILVKDPNDAATMNNLACYLALSGGDKEEALELINSAMRILGSTPSLLDSRGMILLEMDKPHEALRDLEQSVAAQPTASTYLHLAAAYKRLQDQDASAKMMALARTAGLNINQLHPLERTRYASLLQ